MQPNESDSGALTGQELYARWCAALAKRAENVSDADTRRIHTDPPKAWEFIGRSEQTAWYELARSLDE